MSNEHSNSVPTVSISGVDLSRIEYRGEQVVTFAQVDRVHDRPDGTAGRNFRENRQRFVEGQDFVTLDQPDEIRRLGFSRPQGGTPPFVTLLTKRGYLKLTKPMTDDRAWAVQDEMVDRYFMVEHGFAVPRTLSEALRLAADQQDVIDKQNAQIEADKPKTGFYDQFINADGLYGLQNAARALNCRPNLFTRWLKEKFMFYQGAALVPRVQYIQMSIFEVKSEIVEDKARPRSYITPKGLEYLSTRVPPHIRMSAAA